MNTTVFVKNKTIRSFFFLSSNRLNVRPSLTERNKFDHCSKFREKEITKMLDLISLEPLKLSNDVKSKSIFLICYMCINI